MIQVAGGIILAVAVLATLPFLVASLGAGVAAVAENPRWVVGVAVILVGLVVMHTAITELILVPYGSQVPPAFLGPCLLALLPFTVARKYLSQLYGHYSGNKPLSSGVDVFCTASLSVISIGMTIVIVAVGLLQ